MEFEEIVVEAPPEGWTRGYVTIQMKNPDERKPIEAWRRGPFAVHQVFESDGNGARLTHAPTGLMIWSFATMDEAAECAEQIARVADFDAITERLPPGSDIYPKVRKVIDEFAQARTG